ncbi:class I SAM-dependent methyltransferase [Streptomyces himalayensis]|uniref:class I SAM-dependent methyltransferase n=1 Tax=Streptomyces himalayensis TaxID=2820085 RepID=UPI0028A942A2|nr:methyltransferase domain-containing protein [Streptomyces himalayensis]
MTRHFPGEPRVPVPGLSPHGSSCSGRHRGQGMREQLVTSVPQARALDGTAESIPLPDASMDAVLVAEAWHWVETRRAIPEVARVLVPGWVLGLAWNVNDEGDDWSAQLGRTVRRRRSTRGPASWRSDQTCSAYRRASPPAPWQHQLVVTSAGTVSGSEAEADETGLGCGREYFLNGGLPVAGGVPVSGPWRPWDLCDRRTRARQRRLGRPPR